ncbi:FAD/FMN-containing dehydrogenase [Glaciihabitans tibetensis]|uniref:FAD/FMN-containing dehydrogenase n=1 Tax=Glaciihabitans tibetensis TaxID=1266600 RepID=A0A2T0VEG4_9MICO|nr:FAD-binding oxidoreductase [Glaciihabitans tibetensis]PRY68585.1 FAD/FMN-containing dehydrogenase [Glaciihabitans tibetensis]
MAGSDHLSHPLKKRVAGLVAVPTEDSHTALSGRYAIMGEPAIIVRPATAGDVAEAIGFAKDASLAIAVRSGGHSGPAFGDYTDAMVIDLGALDRVVVRGGGLVSVGAGATWGQVAATLGAHDLAITSGDTRSVGVGGLTLGGGFGWLVRKYGLALDALEAVEIVTAAGEVAIASANLNSDLFWAVRGGGGNFGVITEFSFRAHPLPGVVAGAISISAGTSAAASTTPSTEPPFAATLRQWRDVMRTAPEELNTTFFAMPAPVGQEPSAQIVVCYGGADEAAASAAITPLHSVAGAGSHTIGPKRYADVLDDPPPPNAPVRVVALNSFCDDLSDDAIADLTAVQAQLGGVLMIRYLRGAFNRVPAEATAFAHRSAEVLLIVGVFLPQDAPQEAADRVIALWTSLEPHTYGTYGNFTLATDDMITSKMYSPATLRRLRTLKRRYDPENVFRRNHNIVPL